MASSVSTGDVTLLTPGKVVFGWGRFSEIGAEAAALGRDALVVVGKRAMRQSGVLERALKLLAEHEVKGEVFDSVEHDPCLETVEQGTELARKLRCDLVIGIGGGSAMDAAKAVAVMVPQPRPLREYFAGRHFDAAGLPFIAVPTTAGTGAECTRNAVLTDRAAGVKKSLRGAEMVPRVALVDPELTLTMSPAVTAHTGMDALTQAMECYTSKAAQPISDALALAAIPILYRNLPKAVKDGTDRAARTQMALGSLMTGLAFANASLGAVHGLAHPLGFHLQAPHGLTCAVLLPHVLAFNYRACPAKFDEMARVMGVGSGADVPRAIRELLTLLGLPLRLRELGVTERHFRQIISQCRSGSMSNNPRDASDEELLELLREAL